MGDQAAGNWADIIGAISDLGQLIAVLVGLYFAWRGLDSWRGEMKGRRRAEVAEEVLVLIYEAKDQLAWARNAVVFEGEGTSRKPDDEGFEDKHTKSLRDMYFVPAERLRSKAEFWARLSATEFRVKALFGSLAADALRRLHALSVRVALSSKALARHAGEHPEDAPSQEQLSKWKQDIGYGTSGVDEMQKKIEDVVRLIEDEFRPAIEGYQKQQRDWWKWPRMN